MKRLIALALVVSTILAGCSTAVTDHASAESAQLASYSGEELYAGIIFGYGRAGGLVPTVSSYIDQSIEISAAQRQHIDAVIAEIGASNPDFFTQFARDIRSGDHVVIRAALDRALKTTAETTKRDATSAEAIGTGIEVWQLLYKYAYVWWFVVMFELLPGQSGMKTSLVLDALTDDIAALGAL